MFAKFISLLALLCLGMACQSQQPDSEPAPADQPVLVPKGRTVELRGQAGQYQLFRDGQPYEIKGAVGETHLATLAACGGNTFRTYTTEDAQVLLDSAESLGLGVMLGLYLMPGEKGLDYEDPAQVAKQLEWIQKEVLTYKGHPALLMWGLGNELELHYDSPKVWEAINEASRLVHELDPDHPTVSVVLGNEASIRLAAEELTEVDILGINAFGAIDRLSRFLKNDPQSWKGPYLLSEWAGMGPWEAELTDWKAPIELTSMEKTDQLENKFSEMAEGPTDRLLGSFAFYWSDDHVERTHTWFPFFGEKGEKTAMVDVLQRLWTGARPQNEAPQISKLLLGRQSVYANLYLSAGESYQIQVLAHDVEGDSLFYEWELLPESPLEYGIWLDPEPRPAIIPGLWEGDTNREVAHFRAPAEPGAYRIFSYVRDGHGQLAMSNFPFYVVLE